MRIAVIVVSAFCQQFVMQKPANASHDGDGRRQTEGIASMNLAHIHPVIVHFPIVFLLSLAAFDLVAGFAGRDLAAGAVGNLSTGLSVLGGLSAVIAFFFGDMALEIAESGGFSSEIAEIHEGLGMAVATAFGVWALLRAFAWWRSLNLGGTLGKVVPLVEVAGAILVLATAWYGGQLVYDLGVNVAHGPM